MTDKKVSLPGLIKLLKEAGLTHKDLVPVCDVRHSGTISGWSRTNTRPHDLQILVKIADFLSKKLLRIVTVDELLERDIPTIKFELEQLQLQKK